MDNIVEDELAEEIGVDSYEEFVRKEMTQAGDDDDAKQTNVLSTNLYLVDMINLIGCNFFMSKSNVGVCKGLTAFLFDVIFEKLRRFGDRNLSTKMNRSYYRLIKLVLGFVVVDLSHCADSYVVVLNNLIAYLNEMNSRPKSYFKFDVYLSLIAKFRVGEGFGREGDDARIKQFVDANLSFLDNLKRNAANLKESESLMRTILGEVVENLVSVVNKNYPMHVNVILKTLIENLGLNMELRKWNCETPLQILVKTLKKHEEKTRKINTNDGYLSTEALISQTINNPH